MGAGYNPKQRIRTGQGRLLDCLWVRKGQSVTQTAKDIGIGRDRIFMWRKRGEVPLLYVGQVSRALKVPMLALNYEGISWLMGKSQEWDHIVQMCGLEEGCIQYIKKGTPPKSLEQLKEIM